MDAAFKVFHLQQMSLVFHTGAMLDGQLTALQSIGIQFLIELFIGLDEIEEIQVVFVHLFPFISLCEETDVVADEGQ